MNIDKRIIWAVVTIGIYAFIFNAGVSNLFGLLPALLVAGAISWHEMCHLMAAKKMGLGTKGFTLYPFIGGVALVTSRYRTYGQQAFVVLAGPMGGGLGALVTAGVYALVHYVFHVDCNWLAAAAYWMAFLNLFNLAPLSFMDGGQIMGTITYSIHRTLGVVCLVISTLAAGAILLKFAPILGLFIVLFGGMQVYSELKNWNAWRKDETWLCSPNWIRPPKNLSVFQMVATIGCWVTSAVVLSALMYWITVTNSTASNMSFLFGH